MFLLDTHTASTSSFILKLLPLELSRWIRSQIWRHQPKFPFFLSILLPKFVSIWDSLTHLHGCNAEDKCQVHWVQCKWRSRCWDGGGGGEHGRNKREELRWDGITVYKMLIMNYYNFLMCHSFIQQIFFSFLKMTLLMGKVQIFL